MAIQNNPQYVKAGQSWSGCPDGIAKVSGYYQYGAATPVITGYKNPATGAGWTPAELSSFMQGGTTTPSTGTTPTVGAATTPTPLQNPGISNLPAGVTATGGTTPTAEQLAASHAGMPVGPDQYNGVPLPSHAGMPVGPDQFDGQPIGAGTPPGGAPNFGGGAALNIPSPTITPAPAYEISPAQTAFEEMLGGKITDWVESGGYGIPEETQALMIQQQTDALKAREQESIRVMTNNMERRGITNSGFVFANEQNIRSNTSVAIAGAIADVQINSALMKMASFEKAMGAAGQFLGYLSEQSQLKYAPEFATWQAEQLATMQVWQGKLDVYKMELNQAYQTQNMKLQAQLTSQLNAEQNQYNVELAEMELEANNKIAMMQGVGGLFGTVLGFIFGK